tara:strand:- start:732 stop:3644 length:2913 start_codon:yes stop_codon:yes gene_type:complete
MNPTHPAFEWLRSQKIESLNVTVEEYRHRITGAQHIHIASDNQENVFLVALRTVPNDSSGVAHILEHTALCGSEKYPVRDPFFMMIRRSLNTFMNAFTSSDWTAYPFASQNKKDFNNLLDVYLDAVFFSRLDELDFAQEGHRVEFESMEDSSTPLVYKGVVFNEMKGAMSSVPSQLWQTLCKHLYPTTTYHHNSGGDPEAIPDLSYEQLKSFYKTHYHPSNAIFMTFGDISAFDHQVKFQNQALQSFKPLEHEISVPDEKRYYAPVRAEEAYPLADKDGTDKKTHIVMGWLLGVSTNLEETLKAQLLASVLFDNSASPLQQALETTNLGTAPSPLCGLDDSQRELTFVCGIEGSDPEHAGALEQLVLDTLSNIADKGIPKEQLEASLHQLELQQREVGGDSYPYGLQIILTSLTSATHRGDPIALLDLEPALASLRQSIESTDFIKQLARELLLDNPHRVRLTLRPDANMDNLRQAAEIAQLAIKKSAMSEAQQQQVIVQAKALAERQLQVDDEGVLPKVGLEDIPEKLHYTEGQQSELNQQLLSRYATGTNGLVYQQIIIKLPTLSAELLPLLPLYSICLTEVGIGNQDYLQTQSRQAQVVGSLSAYSQIRGASDDVHTLDAYFTLSSKALSRNQHAMTELMLETLEQVRFDELPRLAELVAQVRARREQSVTGSGHGLAMGAASAGMCASAKLSHELSGLAGIVSIKQLDNAIKDETVLRTFAEQLQQLHQLVINAPRQYLLIGEEERLDDYALAMSSWTTPNNSEFAAFALPTVNAKIAQAWITSTQVNFCASAYPTVPMSHQDAPALTVLGGFLRNGFLHRTIREQGGAYGGGASQDNNIGAFRFYSYRDPRLADTLKDFEAALEWLQKNTHDSDQVEQAIMGVISSIDKPGSPAGEAKQTFHAELFGRDRDKRERFRTRLLSVNIDDLKRVATTYLTSDKASVAVITSSDNIEAVTELGLDVINL